jgi:hypothetical protein
LPSLTPGSRVSFDKTNAVFAACVFLVSFVVYALTVQPSFSFWDCGEFIACAHILGIPHPPGTPLFVLIGHVFSLIPFVEDISHRINYVSVISSAFTAFFSYLLIVRIVGYFFSPEERHLPINRWIAYIGGVCGAFFVAFSATNWSNSVEAEVYGSSLAAMVLMFWLTIQYFEQRGTRRGTQIMILVFYTALASVGIHQTPFLIVPVIAIFYIFNKDATARDYAMVSGFIIVELLMVMLFSSAGMGVNLFYMISGLLGIGLLVMLYKKLNWGMLIAVGSISALLVGFGDFLKVAPLGLVLLVVLGILSKRFGWRLDWKSGAVIILVGLIGFASHLYIPIRSEHSPRIDENNPSRDLKTFVNFLDRKQYGQKSMIDRMFDRRGQWINQLGRHANMGYWSYFEEQYSIGGVYFLPLLGLGLLGMLVAIRKRVEIGMPFFTLFLLCSVGLVLYMNFADGTQYNAATGDAYLEVRNRDYFFTPAFVFFGIALGLGISALVQWLKQSLAASGAGMQQTAVYASTILILLPSISLAHNYHPNDRSGNFIPYYYSKNILDTCEPNAILFTSGDNDTFPVWCLQEVYDYRKDVRVVNLSLLNTDWYVWQMKEQYNVPIALTKEQIWWYDYEYAPGQWTSQPKERFHDRARQRMEFMQANGYQGRVVKVQDMMVDEIVLENKWQVPIYFSSQPYAESPLKLRDRATADGVIYRLDRTPPENLLDLEHGLHLYQEVYRFDGFESSKVYRDENATGVFLSVGTNATRIFDGLDKAGRMEEAKQFMTRIIDLYPEFWQSSFVLADQYEVEGDTARADQLLWKLHDTLQAYFGSNRQNFFYQQDLGLVKVEIGRNKTDRGALAGDTVMVQEGQKLIDDGVDLMWAAFEVNPNNSYSFRKLVSVLSQLQRFNDLRKAAMQFAEYKVNRSDPVLQRILNFNAAPSPQPGG